MELHRSLTFRFVAFSIMAMVVGCGPTAPTKPEIEYLQALMPDELTKYAGLEVASEESISIISNDEADYLGLHIYPRQRKVSGGIRAEVSVDYPFEPGDVLRYSWRFMLPADFVSDAPENRWWVIGQWHDQPNVDRGESWDNFESRSPPVLIGMGEIDGVLAIGLNYGPTHNDLKQEVLGPVFLQRGKWHDLSVEIKWSLDDDGYARLFLDDPSQPVMAASGPNMNNDFCHYLKLGMYRHPSIKTDNWIYLDDLQIEKLAL
jgi:hypothetical protein